MLTRHILAATLLLALGAGCAPNLEAISREVAGTSVDESVDRLTEEDGGEQDGASGGEDGAQEHAASSGGEVPGESADTPDTPAAHLSQHLTLGLADALDSPEVRRQIAALTRSATQASLQEALGTLSNEEARRDLTSLTHVAAQALAEDLRRTLSPALAQAMQVDLVPALSAALASPDVREQLGETTRSVSEQAVVGAGRGMGAALHDVSVLDSGLFWLVVIPAVALCVALVAAAVIAVARARQAVAQVQRLENATLVLAESVRNDQGANGGSPPRRSSVSGHADAHA